LTGRPKIINKRSMEEWIRHFKFRQFQSTAVLTHETKSKSNFSVKCYQQNTIGIQRGSKI